MVLNGSSKLDDIQVKLSAANTSDVRNLATVIEDAKTELYRLFNSEIGEGTDDQTKLKAIVDELVQKEIDLKNKIDADIKPHFASNNDVFLFRKNVTSHRATTANAATAADRTSAAQELKDAIKRLHLALGGGKKLFNDTSFSLDPNLNIANEPRLKSLVENRSRNDAQIQTEINRLMTENHTTQHRFFVSKTKVDDRDQREVLMRIMILLHVYYAACNDTSIQMQSTVVNSIRSTLVPSIDNLIAPSYKGLYQSHRAKERSEKYDSVLKDLNANVSAIPDDTQDLAAGSRSSTVLHLENYFLQAPLTADAAEDYRIRLDEIECTNSIGASYTCKLHSGKAQIRIDPVTKTSGKEIVIVTINGTDVQVAELQLDLGLPAKINIDRKSEADIAAQLPAGNTTIMPRELNIPIQAIVPIRQGAVQTGTVASTKPRKIQLNGANRTTGTGPPPPPPPPPVSLKQRDATATFSQVDRGNGHQTVVGDMTEELLQNFMAERQQSRLGDDPSMMRRLGVTAVGALTDHWVRYRQRRRIREQVLAQKSDAQGQQQLALDEDRSDIAELHAAQHAERTGDNEYRHVNRVFELDATVLPHLHTELNRITQNYYLQGLNGRPAVLDQELINQIRDLFAPATTVTNPPRSADVIRELDTLHQILNNHGIAIDRCAGTILRQCQAQRAETSLKHKISVLGGTLPSIPSPTDLTRVQQQIVTLLQEHTKQTTTVVPQLVDDRNHTFSSSASDHIESNESYQQMAEKLTRHVGVLAAMRSEIEAERVTINAQFITGGRSGDYTNTRRQEGNMVSRGFFAVGEYLADKPAILRYTLKAAVVTGATFGGLTMARRAAPLLGAGSAAYFAASKKRYQNRKRMEMEYRDALKSLPENGATLAENEALEHLHNYLTTYGDYERISSRMQELISRDRLSVAEQDELGELINCIAAGMDHQQRTGYPSFAVAGPSARGNEVQQNLQLQANYAKAMVHLRRLLGQGSERLRPHAFGRVPTGRSTEQQIQDLLTDTAFQRRVEASRGGRSYEYIRGQYQQQFQAFENTFSNEQTKQMAVSAAKTASIFIVSGVLAKALDAIGVFDWIGEKTGLRSGDQQGTPHNPTSPGNPQTPAHLYDPNNSIYDGTEQQGPYTPHASPDHPATNESMIDERLYQHNLGQYKEEWLKIGNLDRDMRGFWANTSDVQSGAKLEIDLYARVDGTQFVHANGPEDIMRLKAEIIDLVNRGGFNGKTVDSVKDLLHDEPRKEFLAKKIPSDLSNQHLFQERLLEGMKVQLEEAAHMGRQADVTIEFDFKESLSRAGGAAHTLQDRAFGSHITVHNPSGPTIDTSTDSERRKTSYGLYTEDSKYKKPRIPSQGPGATSPTPGGMPTMV